MRDVCKVDFTNIILFIFSRFHFRQGQLFREHPFTMWRDFVALFQIRTTCSWRNYDMICVEWRSRTASMRAINGRTVPLWKKLEIREIVDLVGYVQKLVTWLSGRNMIENQILRCESDDHPWVWTHRSWCPKSKAGINGPTNTTAWLSWKIKKIETLRCLTSIQ